MKKKYIFPLALRKQFYDALIDEQYRRYIEEGKKISLTKLIYELIEKTYVVSGK